MEVKHIVRILSNIIQIVVYACFYCMIITDEVLYLADKNTNHVTTVLAGVRACACTCRYGCACGCACVSYYHNRQNVTFLNLRHRRLKLRLISAHTLNNNRNADISSYVFVIT